MAVSDFYELIPKVKRTLVISWDNGAGYFMSGGSRRDMESFDIPTGINTLSIGSYLKGKYPLNGKIHWYQIGAGYLTPEKAEEIIAKHETNQVLLVAAGQSLAEGYWYSREDDHSNGGFKTLVRQITGNLPASRVVAIESSVGGASIIKRHDAQGRYWWDEDLDAPGPLLEKMYHELDQVGLIPQYILWVQGEQDALKIELSARAGTAQEYENQLLKVLKHIRSRYPEVKVFVNIIGRRLANINNENGTQIIRAIQKKIIREHDWIHHGVEQYDATLFDDVHPNNASYENLGRSVGELISKHILKNKKEYPGPVISGVSRKGKNIIVELRHNEGKDFTPKEGISGFVYFDQVGKPIDIVSLKHLGPKKLQLILEKEPVPGGDKLYYIYDTADDVDVSAVVRDNSKFMYPLASAQFSEIEESGKFRNDFAIYQ
jgi:lysophospholipase L1-like esterase